MIVEYNGRRYNGEKGYKYIVRPVTIIGRRTSFTTVNDLWPNGSAIDGDYTVPASAGVTLGISSGSANDASAGTGAQTVTVLALTTDYVEEEITYSLNGQTMVDTDVNGKSWTVVAVNAAWCATFGTGLQNAGKIYLYDSTDTVTTGENQTIAKRLSIIDTNENYAQAGIYTVPTIGGDVCDLLVTGISTATMDATTTIKYPVYNLLANHTRWHGRDIGAALANSWFRNDIESGPSSSGAATWPPAGMMEPYVILNGGTIRAQGTSSAAPAIAGGIEINGLLAARE